MLSSGTTLPQNSSSTLDLENSLTNRDNDKVFLSVQNKTTDTKLNTLSTLSNTSLDNTLYSLSSSSTTTKKMSSTSLDEQYHRQKRRRTLSLQSTHITNPFAFEREDLECLLDPKNLNLLRSIGGLDGLLKGLQTDHKTGLSSDEVILQSNITLKDITDQDHIEFGKPSTPDHGSNAKEKNSKNTPSPKVPPEILKEGTQFYQRICVFGRNVLPTRKPKSILKLMWMAIQEKILILLTIAAVISLGLGLYEDFGTEQKVVDGVAQPKIRWVEGVAIIIAIVIVVMVGSLNDWQKELQFQKLNSKKEDRQVKVIRDSKETLISVHDIMVGDILRLEPGDIASADGVLVSGYNLKCDESTSTGESDAVRKMKYEDCIELLDVESGPSELHDSKPDPFIISGSRVLEGLGTYVVTAVGVNSFHGKIMMSLRSDPEDTPLQVKLNDLAERIAKLGGGAALLMLIILLVKYFIGFRNGIPETTTVFDSLIQILISTITVVVVAVPEGLPLAVTLALAYATTRMLKDNNLVRVLSACETMGNATTICSDKTGTLTQNKMTVVVGTIGLDASFVRDYGEQATTESHQGGNNIVFQKKTISDAILRLLDESISINSTAFEGEPVNGRPTFVGSKTETALLEFIFDLKLRDYKELRENANIVQMFPFSSEHKAMGVVVREGGENWRFFVKGASEVLLNKSEYIINTDDDGVINLNQENKKAIRERIEQYALESLRTIALGYRDFKEWPPFGMNDDEISFEKLTEDITLLSIMGIEDPLREGVREAVQDCHKAGVKVRMVTGDNILTAKSIATKCGIYNGGIVMEGPEFRNLSPEKMMNVVPHLQVLARSSPEDKRILVGKLRELDDIVAVTGDGTNDGPALKTADVGFSMGIAGTEVAKEASSIILMDDNFSSIVKAIMWGRSVNDAVKKFLQFQLTVNITAVLLTFISAISSDKEESIFTAVQLLWINLIMDTFAALALATDPPTPDLLDRLPEPRNSPLISLDMWKMIIGQSIFQLTIVLVFLYGGNDILGYETDAEKSGLNTLIFNIFVFLQIFNEINCRRLDNRLNILKGITANTFFLIIFLIMIAGQFIIVTFGGAAFQTQKLSVVQWAICVGLGFLSIPVGALIRLIPNKIFKSIYSNRQQQEKEVWDDAVTKIQNQLKVFQAIRGGRVRAHFGDRNNKTTQGSTVAAMLPSLFSASVGAGGALALRNNSGTSTRNTSSGQFDLTPRRQSRQPKISSNTSAQPGNSGNVNDVVLEVDDSMEIQSSS
ncbi:7259_t:CDS:2 [Acaulospora morrowiae]|uniref:Calcium-transporting ATPase n=1 Tax=Acaulospora morrowiae TaxID=94023 RepID=A0A9N8YTY3_9GLOM|nr:7259_t:CDS:2 [Acaulospora morrowiae]